METHSLTRKAILVLLIFSFTVLVLPKLFTVRAIGAGLDAPIMGITCGNPDGDTPEKKACCPLPDVNKPFAHGQVDILGNAGPIQPKAKNKSILSKIGGVVTGVLGGIGHVAIDTLKLATGDFSGVAKDLMNLMLNVGVPLVNKTAQQQVNTSLLKYTEDANQAVSSFKTVGKQCMPNTYADDTHGSCVCKPFGNEAGIPQAERTDWNKWIAEKTPPERQYALANVQVLGTSNDPTNVAFLNACLGIADPYNRAQCQRQYAATAPRFIFECNKIKDPTEKANCQNCISNGALGTSNGAAPATNPSTNGETINGVWTSIGCVPADLGKFVSNKFIPFALGLGGAAAMLVLMYAAYLYTTSQGNPEKLRKAKDYMNSGLIGLLLIIFGVFLLQLLGVTILHIPGFSPA